MTWQLLDQQPQWLSVMVIALLAFGLLITVVSAYQRLKQSLPRLALVCLLNLAAILGLLGLLSDITLPTDNKSRVVLITQYSPSPTQINQLIDEQSSQQTIYVMQDYVSDWQSPEDVLPTNWHILQQPEELLSWQPDMQHLWVFGDGLTATQWHNLAQLSGQTWPESLPFSIEFTPSPRRAGMVNMQWHKQLVMGEYQTISGQLSAPDSSGDFYQLSLENPAGEPMQTITLRDTEGFEFSFQPRSSGQWRYGLSLATKEQQITRENLAFSVTQADVPSIFIRQSAPSFETRQLKNWAAKFGAKVHLETQISQNRFITQSLNMTEAEQSGYESGIDNNLLSDIDLLVIDGRALSDLPQEQMAAIRLAVETGLGVLILADETLLQQHNSSSISLLSSLQMSISSTGQPNRSAQLSWSNNQAEEPVQVLNADIRSRVSDGPSLNALVTDTERNSVVVIQNYAQGQLAINLFNGSHQWQTAGLTSLYSHYWQTLFKATSRGAAPPYWLPADSAQIDRINQPSMACAKLADSSQYPTDLVISARQSDNQLNQAELSLTPHLLFDQQACTTFWLARSGWQQLELTVKNKVTTQHRYAYAGDQWSAWQQHNTHKATSNLALRPAQSTSNSDQTVVSKWWFWWILIASCIAMWIERKFF